MVYSNDELQGKEMNVDDHPADNIEHPDPGPRVKMAGTVIDRSSQFGDLQYANKVLDEFAAVTGVKRPSTQPTPATVIKLPTIKK